MTRDEAYRLCSERKHSGLVVHVPKRKIVVSFNFVEDSGKRVTSKITLLDVTDEDLDRFEALLG